MYNHLTEMGHPKYSRLKVYTVLKRSVVTAQTQRLTCSEKFSILLVDGRQILYFGTLVEAGNTSLARYAQYCQRHNYPQLISRFHSSISLRSNSTILAD